MRRSTKAGERRKTRMIAASCPNVLDPIRKGRSSLFAFTVIHFSIAFAISQNFFPVKLVYLVSIEWRTRHRNRKVVSLTSIKLHNKLKKSRNVFPFDSLCMITENCHIRSEKTMKFVFSFECDKAENI